MQEKETQKDMFKKLSSKIMSLALMFASKLVNNNRLMKNNRDTMKLNKEFYLVMM